MTYDDDDDADECERIAPNDPLLQAEIKAAFEGARARVGDAAEPVNPVVEAAWQTHLAGENTK